MRNALTKLLAFLMILTAVLLAMWLTITMKYRAVEALYSNTQLEIRAIEAEQYVNTIEYGIKYGKQLENFFDMDELLNSIYMSSSYMEGVYVLSGGGELLFHAGSMSGSIPDISQQSLEGRLYGSVNDGENVYIYLDINDQNDVPQGKLLIKLDGDAMQHIVNSEKRAALKQSIVISLEICALGAVIIIASKMKAGRKRLRAFALLFWMCLLLSQGIDSAIETIKINQKVENTTIQSAQKIAQVIQEQIDNVVKKGIPAADISDINSYLKKNASACKMIDALTLSDKDKVQVQVSRSYIRDTVNGFVSETAVVLLCLFGVGLLLNSTVWIATRSGRYKRKYQKIEETA